MHCAAQLQCAYCPTFHHFLPQPNFVSGNVMNVKLYKSSHVASNDQPSMLQRNPEWHDTAPAIGMFSCD